MGGQAPKEGAPSGGSGRQEVMLLYRDLMVIDVPWKGNYQDALEGQTVVVGIVAICDTVVLWPTSGCCARADHMPASEWKVVH